VKHQIPGQAGKEGKSGKMRENVRKHPLHRTKKAQTMPRRLTEAVWGDLVGNKGGNGGHWWRRVEKGGNKTPTSPVGKGSGKIISTIPISGIMVTLE